MNRMQDQTETSRISLGGGISVGNNYLLDGYPITDLQNRASISPNIEMVDDVKVQVHTYDAEMGRTGGGMFNASARSGTNRFPGSGFILSRPGALIGENFFLKIQGQANPDQYWRNGGGGGPLVRNKTFFWFASEAYRDGLTQNGNLHVPTAAERAGDFSGLMDAAGRPIIIYDPLTTDPVTGARRAFDGNRIPLDRINPVGDCEARSDKGSSVNPVWRHSLNADYPLLLIADFRESPDLLRDVGICRTLRFDALDERVAIVPRRRLCVTDCS
jgi:trimeric autotransporter adhesin